jgi:hypothetical protein
MDNQRHIFLNYMQSRSRSRAPEAHKPPTHAGKELLTIIAVRQKADLAIGVRRGFRGMGPIVS